MSSSGGPVAPASGYQNPPAGVAVGASPFTYQNPNLYSEDLAVSVGTVTGMDFSRDGATWFATGVIAGVVRLSPSDRLKITYTLAPTVTRIPR